MSDNVPRPRYTIWQAISAALGLSTRAIEEIRALKNAAPPVARFPLVSAWDDRVHYNGSLVAHKGATWQANKDTAREPPHPDWTLLAAPGAAGVDAPVGEVCGLYETGRAYRKYDLVTWHGSEWRARVDKPGKLPGDDWVLSGQSGSRGKAGERGERGPAGPTITSWEMRDYRAVPIFSDGSVGPALDLREFFEQYDRERG